MTHRTERSTAKRLWLASLTAAVALLAFVATASAARDPIAAGTTDLHMKKGFLRKLANNGIAVQGLGAGTITGNKIGLTVRGGKLNPVKALGYLEDRGGFKFSRGQRGVPVTEIKVNTVSLGVYARIAKAHMQLGTLLLPVVDREGFGANLKSIKLSLTAKATKRISNRLGLKGSRRLNPGRVLSNLYATAQPETVEILRKGNATLAADPGTFGKFAEKGVKMPEGVTALAPATHPNELSFEFPIAGGNVAPDASQGSLETSGGVQIVKDAEPFSPTLKMKDFSLDFSAKAATVELEILPTPPFPGAAGRSALVDLVLPPGSVVTDPVARKIAIQGGEARLQTGAASTLNDVFNQPAPSPPPSSNFVVGDLLGKFSLQAQAR